MTQADVFRTAVPFAVVLGLAVLLAVYGWMRAIETWRDKHARRTVERGWLAFAPLHSAAVLSAWCVLAS